MRTRISIGIIAGATFWAYHQLLLFMHNNPNFLFYMLVNVTLSAAVLCTLCFTIKNKEQWLKVGACTVLLCILMKVLSLIGWPLLFGIDDVLRTDLFMVAIYYAGIISFLISPFYLFWKVLPEKSAYVKHEEDDDDDFDGRYPRHCMNDDDDDDDDDDNNKPNNARLAYFFSALFAGLTFFAIIVLNLIP